MRIFAFAVISVLIFACSKPPKHPGFTEVKPGLFLKLVSFESEGAGKKDTSCHVYETYYMLLAEDTLNQLFHDNLPGWIARDDIRFESLNRYLVHLSRGDSAVFLDEQKLEAGDSLTEVHISLRNCYSPDEFAAEYEKWVLQREMTEQLRINNFIDNHGFVPSIVQPAVWIRTDVSGEGEPISMGQEISFFYRGLFLTGQEVESTDDLLIFILGTEGQVIDGLTYGLIGARPGEVRTIVIPSQFAFGDSGSSTGIIPPFTPMVYEVQVMEVVK